jgi:hypothetical protein
MVTTTKNRRITAITIGLLKLKNEFRAIFSKNDEEQTNENLQNSCYKKVSVNPLKPDQDIQEFK